jgi:hypothetical protein
MLDCSQSCPSKGTSLSEKQITYQIIRHTCRPLWYPAGYAAWFNQHMKGMVHQLNKSRTNIPWHIIDTSLQHFCGSCPRRTSATTSTSHRLRTSIRFRLKQYTTQSFWLTPVVLLSNLVSIRVSVEKHYSLPYAAYDTLSAQASIAQMYHVFHDPRPVPRCNSTRFPVAVLLHLYLDE